MCVACSSGVQVATPYAVPCQKLPDSIGNCVNLKVLTLNGNQLRELPNSIGACSKMRKLMLQVQAGAGARVRRDLDVDAKFSGRF